MNNNSGNELTGKNSDYNEVIKIIFSLNGDNINEQIMSKRDSNTYDSVINMYIKEHSIPLALRKRLMYQRAVNS